MESERLLSAGSVNGSSGDYGSWSDADRGGSAGGRRMSYSVAGESCSVDGEAVDEDVYIQQAVVFIEDAIQVPHPSPYINDLINLKPQIKGLGLTIAVVLLLAFVERPSSLSMSSDPRRHSPSWEPPCGLTESIEAVCLLVFTLDLASYLIGWEEFRKTKWLIGYTAVISVSVIDWMLSASMVCDEKLRVRRLIRPFFLLQNSSLMKKTLKCIKRTLPEIASLHLCVSSTDPKKNGEWDTYFRDLPTSLTSLLVLLTTANNPDVMIPAYSLNRAYSLFFITFSVIGTYCLMNLLTAIIYNQFRGYLLMSVQTSIIRRRLGIRAAFQVLSCRGSRQAAEESVCVAAVLKVMSKVTMKSYYREAIVLKRCSRSALAGIVRGFESLTVCLISQHPPLPQYSSAVLQRLQLLFSHYYLTLLGNAVALANVICICTVLVLNSEKSTAERDSYIMEIINLGFILYYLFEMCVKIFAFGWRGYVSYRNNVFDGFLTVLLLVLQISIFATYRFPSSHGDPSSYNVTSLWEMVRFINMLIVFRFLRIIPDIKLMALVASTLVDLVKNLRAFAGILVVVYYVFAVLGIWLFEGAIKPPPDMSILSNSTMENITSNYSMECGTYEQLDYWPNNFNDFAASIILLYDIMVVNNWQVFLEAFSKYTTPWSKVYFVCWWLTSSVMWVNLFVALILENFIYKWDRSHSCSVTDVERIRYETSVQLMFKEQIQEPTEEELLCQLHQHPHLHLHW
uniref:Ion transport domain-containing protein n=1 Tax=Sphaeramia orbicularis TaxID=375764 RepID=A0A672ZB80_9TELE